MAKIIKILASASATWWREGNFNKIIINIIGIIRLSSLRYFPFFLLLLKLFLLRLFVSVIIGVGCRRVVLYTYYVLLFFTYNNLINNTLLLLLLFFFLLLFIICCCVIIYV